MAARRLAEVANQRSEDPALAFLDEWELGFESTHPEIPLPPERMTEGQFLLALEGLPWI